MFKGEKTLVQINVSKIVFSLFFLGIIAIVPAFVHTQWFTGPLVNALLILTCVLIGPMEAVIFGLVPSTVALSAGLLPLPLAPMIPFIMLANGFFVALFYYIYKKSFLAAVIVSALVKFMVLQATVVLLMRKFLEAKFLQNLALMMSWPQFATAVIGGIIAYAILKTTKINLKK